MHEEAFDQKRNIFFTVPQRRQCKANDVQTVKQVFPETSRGYLPFQIAVRCGDNADIDPDPLQ